MAQQSIYGFVRVFEHGTFMLLRAIYDTNSTINFSSINDQHNNLLILVEKVIKKKCL